MIVKDERLCQASAERRPESQGVLAQGLPLRGGGGWGSSNELLSWAGLLLRTGEWPGGPPWPWEGSSGSGQLRWGRVEGQALALDGETRGPGPSVCRGGLCRHAPGLRCVCFIVRAALDRATEEMGNPCPVSKGDRSALSNAPFKLHPGRGV